MRESSSNADGDEAAVPVSGQSKSTGNAVQISRDEMNLAEFPLTVLSKRADPSIKTLEFTDQIKGKNGDFITRSWIITGADKFGLPTSSDDEVLLGLLKLTAEDGLKSRKVHFTRYELLKALRWTTEGRSYTRLQNALDRLSGVRIKASNAFYDNETKLHSTRNFGIIDAYEINDGRDTRPSFFTWSEVLFKSFQVGFIKKLDLDFYLDLQSAVSKRLYRYMDKHFWYRSRIQINLFTLCHEKIGISRNYVYASSLRQQLEPALEELQERGVLSEFGFSGRGSATEVFMQAAQGAKKTLPNASQGNVSSLGEEALLSQNMGEKASPRESEVNHGHFSESRSLLVGELVKRGIAQRQAERLVAGIPAASEQKLAKIIEYFDLLVASGSHLVSRNPMGFLYRAIERHEDFVLPGERAADLRGARSEKEVIGAVGRPGIAEKKRGVSSSAVSARHKAELERQYAAARKVAFEGIRSRLDDGAISAVWREVEAGLSSVRSFISEQRFREAVELGVEQRFLDQEDFPSFDTWIKDRERGA